MRKQKKAPAGKQGRKAKEQMKMRLYSLRKYTHNFPIIKILHNLFLVVAFITLMGLILMKGGVR